MADGPPPSAVIGGELSEESLDCSQSNREPASEQGRGRMRAGSERFASRPQTALTRRSDAQTRMVDRNGGAVRGRDRSLADVAALRGGGLQTQDLVDGCFEVL